MRYFILFALFLLTSFHAFAAEKKTAYDHVMATRTLRCAYLPYEPFIIKDINTGKISGLTADYLEAAAARQGIKIEWSGEVNVDQVVPALESGRFDAFCLPCTPDSVWEKVLDFTAELGALPYYVYVRKDSSFMKEHLDTARFSVVDGYALTEITKQYFPHAKLLGLPQTTSTADMYNQLRFKKADAHINEAVSALNYDRNNPGIIKAFSENPLVSMRMFLISRKEDVAMRGFLDRTFGTDKPENLALAQSFRKKYNLPDNVFLLGPQCRNKTTTKKGERICASQ